MTYISKDGSTLVADSREDVIYSDEFVLLHDSRVDDILADIENINTRMENIKHGTPQDYRN